MGTPTDRTPGIDPERPHPARVYDYLLGGACNFASDREFAERFLAAVPTAAHAARVNRAFLRRALLFCREQGVDQFLDLGSGLPTAGSVHQILPGARVVYVDDDPIVVARGEDVLQAVPAARAVSADLRDADAVLRAARGLIDFERPVGVLALAVLHFLPDAEEALAPYVAAMAPGSALVVTHGTADAAPENVADVGRLYADNGTPGVSRSREEVAELFRGLRLVPPGVVWTSQWRPEAESGEDPSSSFAYAAVGMRP